MVGGAGDGDFCIGNDGSLFIGDDATQAAASCGELLAVEIARYANPRRDRKSGQQETLSPELLHTLPPKGTEISRVANMAISHLKFMRPRYHTRFVPECCSLTFYFAACIARHGNESQWKTD